MFPVNPEHIKDAVGSARTVEDLAAAVRAARKGGGVLFAAALLGSRWDLASGRRIVASLLERFVVARAYPQFVGLALMDYAERTEFARTVPGLPDRLTLWRAVSNSATGWYLRRDHALAAWRDAARIYALETVEVSRSQVIALKLSSTRAPEFVLPSYGRVRVAEVLW